MSSPDNADTTTPQQVIVDQELKEHKDHKEQPTVRLNGEVVELTKPLHAHTHTADNTDVSEAENGDESEDDDLAEELNPDEEYIDLTNRRLGKLPDLSHLTNCKVRALYNVPYAACGDKQGLLLPPTPSHSTSTTW